jgi:hypothetical protein
MATRWHYTVRDRLRRIFGDGLIRPSTALVPAGEKPAVWFSANPDWEPSANKAIRLPTGEGAVRLRD